MQAANQQRAPMAGQHTQRLPAALGSKNGGAGGAQAVNVAQ